jgi:hypothetical protein
MAGRTRRGDDRRMLRRSILVVIAAALAAVSTSFATTNTTEFSQRVTRICGGALLFDGEHAIGTRAGAIAVSRDIRRTGMRRLLRVAAVAEPARQAPMIRRWLRVEHLLVFAFARDYLRIWDEIESAQTPPQRAGLPARLGALAHQPDRLKRRADAYELRLGVPDCTGGGHVAQSPPPQTQTG